MEEKKRDYTKIINRLIIIIGVGLLLHLVFLLLTLEKKYFSRLLDIGWLYLFIIAILAFCPMLGHALRIAMWSKFLKLPISLKNSVKIVLANDIGSAIAPSIIGGGPIKLGMLMNNGMNASQATFMVVYSMCEDLVFYACGILLTCVYFSQYLDAIYKILLDNVFIFSIVLFIFLFPILFRKWSIAIEDKLLNYFPKKISEKIKNFRKGTKSHLKEIKSVFGQVIKTGSWRIPLSILILFFQWFTKFTIFAVLLLSLGINFSWFEIYVKQWVVWISTLIIPTPGGSGGAEAGFLLLFKNNLQPEIANLIVSTWRFFTYYFILIISIILFNYFARRDRTI